ncbi:fibrillarin-like rRNA/tRNA 2'-O-methyltransferase [Candidatus Woesearchaeota archaeon]|nr:MAG: fibrillarin-like rRNA/tRNA 2'-O-methyltransferase [Candidatus Woesearchaeota archaeon]
MRETRLKGVFEEKGRLFTKNLVPRKSVYGERLVRVQGVEYREWDPRRSKLCAGIKKGASQIGIYPDSKVLYLGASTGTTISHVSDIVGENGFVVGVDIAPRTTRELVFLSEERSNLAPLLADANHPEHYPQLIEFDALFQDVAQKNQVEIFLKNMALVKKGGFGLLCVKSRSIDVTKKPSIIYKEVLRELEKHITVVDKRTLEPFEQDHILYICKKK